MVEISDLHLMFKLDFHMSDMGMLTECPIQRSKIRKLKKSSLRTLHDFIYVTRPVTTQAVARTLHDFIYVTHRVTTQAVTRTRRLCHAGLFQNSTGHVLQNRDRIDIAIPNINASSYARGGMIRALRLNI